MVIHTVEQGDTIYSIANKYNVPYTRIAQDNNLAPNYYLNIGQVIIVSQPEQTYIVKEGDTLASVSNKFGVSIIELLRYNPFLSDRVNYTLIPGEELDIYYKHNVFRFQVIGYAPSHVNINVLKASLPSLTYLAILNYRALATGNIVDIDDIEIINKRVCCSTFTVHIDI